MIDLEQDYYLDVKAILNFISYSDTHSKEIEIIDKYEKDENKNFNTAEKTIKEITTSGDSNMDNISYDLVKILVGQILSWGYDVDPTEQDNQNLPFGLKVAFNTLIKEKLLLKK
jgi:hypothetical protein